MKLKIGKIQGIFAKNPFFWINSRNSVKNSSKFLKKTQAFPQKTRGFAKSTWFLLTKNVQKKPVLMPLSKRTRSCSWPPPLARFHSWWKKAVVYRKVGNRFCLSDQTWCKMWLASLLSRSPDLGGNEISSLPRWKRMSVEVMPSVKPSTSTTQGSLTILILLVVLDSSKGGAG